MPQHNDGKSSDSGSVKVAVRLRPLNNTELASSSSKDSKSLRAWRVHEDRGIDGKVARRTIRQTGEEKAVEGKSLFSFDEIFDEDAATDDIYEAVGSVIVKGSVDGRNGTIFAYGQTGSGKTYTMQGNGLTGSIPKGGVKTEAVDGIIQMVARDLFDHIQSDPAREFLLRVSFVEVYNETVRDLLHDHEDGEFHSKRSSSSPSPKSPQRNSSGDHNALVVREDPKTGGVSMNCKEVIVTDVESLMDTLYNGEKNRIVACTDMNARSSRSHSIFSITIESRESQGGSNRSSRSLGEAWDDEEDDRAVLVSMLNLVDLAGSESVKNTNTTGTRQREGAKINQSLLTLSQVIQSLSLPKGKRPKHINYRDSKLTRILRPSLEGNAVMAILCCATAARIYVEETKSTLRFASRAKLVQTSAKKNEVMDDRALIKRLQKELAEAKRALKELEEAKEKPSVCFADTVKDGDDSKNCEKKSAFRAKVSHLDSAILRGGGPSFANKTDSVFLSRRRTLGCGELKGLEGPQRKRRQQHGSIKMAFEDHLVDLPLYDEEEEDGAMEENPETLEAERRESQTTLENGNGHTNGMSNLHRRSSELDLLKAALELKSSRLAEAEARISELEQDILKSQEKSRTQMQQNRWNVLLLSAFQFALFCISVYYVVQKWGSLEPLGRSLVCIILAEYLLVLVLWNFLLHHGEYTESTHFSFEKKNA